jgi:valyl-tRNA synthetase
LSPTGPCRLRRAGRKTVKQAQVRTVDLLREAGQLDGEPKPITHPVKFYEKGDRPLEIITSRQWYIRNGGRPYTHDGGELREQLLARGAELRWHPPHMQVRYENWVTASTATGSSAASGSSASRSRVWYPLDDDGEPDFSTPARARRAKRLPIDPSIDVPDGYAPRPARPAGRLRRLTPMSWTRGRRRR